MLVIRKSQMEALEADVKRRFIARAVRLLRDRHPEKTAAHADPHLTALVQDALKRGETYGIRTERDVIALAELDVLVEPRFETRPAHGWTRPILADATLRGEAKIKLLVQRFAALEQRGALS